MVKNWVLATVGELIMSQQKFQTVVALSTVLFVDSVRMMCSYCDAVVLRHPQSGSAEVSCRSDVKIM